ncbi:DUF1349 domain-containing protein [Paenibacillus hamazuiensis]|uniref:DUF1349 domain-containing protein n=1 Tax=Paenibacillus hamazuiensis TaxID=2936508 RepID=UPI00200CACF2|nr:DUF1349 domain-containing protein [Paenibacillus hamazuiensis]
MTLKHTEHSKDDGFTQLLRMERIKFRKTRGLVIGIIVALLLTVLPGLLISAAMTGIGPTIPISPNGQAVTDKFYFVHQPLTGDGSITVRLTSLTGLITYPPPNHDQIVSGVVPWAKAGVIIKDGIKQGSAYAALMVTGANGVRMQYNYTNDTAGHPGNVSPESPRWLRLTRSGDIITGYESMDGVQWTKVDTVHLVELPSTAEVGLFVTSPGDITVLEGASRFTSATADFDQLELQGEGTGDSWSYSDIGATIKLDGSVHHPGRASRSGGTFTVTGNGDIAPLGAEGGWTVERCLIGTFAGLIAVMIVAVLFVTAECHRRKKRGSGLAVPCPHKVLAAKAVVISITSFVIGLVAAIFTIVICKQILLSNGNPVLPAAALTEVRIIFGTAALFAFASVLALAFAGLLRRGILAATASIAAVILPYILAFVNALPLDVSRWLLRLTPAAGFAIQQSIPEYPQVIGLYTPQVGYFPLAPWAGFTVLCGYTAIIFGLAISKSHFRSDSLPRKH